MVKGRNQKNKTLENKICIKCSKPKNIKSNFYNSNNGLYPDKKYPVCKQCVTERLNGLDTSSHTFLEEIRSVLLDLNRPFIWSLWSSSVDEAKNRGWTDVFGCYMKNLSLPQNRELTWTNSIFDQKQILSNSNIDEKVSHQKEKVEFTVTKEMQIRWGQNYDIEDYIKLEDFYNKMKDMNRIETPQEETYLKKLSVISLKMDQELENGNYGQVKQLGDLFSKYMADSKFRAMDKSEADKSGGIRTFSAIFMEVEKDDHIPPWEYYRNIKGLEQDIIDQTIMHIENFTLRLNKIERMIEPPAETPKLDSDEE